MGPPLPWTWPAAGAGPLPLPPLPASPASASPAAPSTSYTCTRSLAGSTVTPCCRTTVPLTLTRPASMSVSTARREATPQAASTWRAAAADQRSCLRARLSSTGFQAWRLRATARLMPPKAGEKEPLRAARATSQPVPLQGEAAIPHLLREIWICRFALERPLVSPPTHRGRLHQRCCPGLDLLATHPTSRTWLCKAYLAGSC